MPISDLEPDTRIFEWLGNDQDGVGYYLHALNLRWRNEGPDGDIAEFLRVASLLRSDCDYWRSIIRTRAWRHTLVGTVCAILANATDLYPDLEFAFERGNFVSPQVGIAMGLLSAAQSRARLTRFVQETNGRSTKEIGAAFAVLGELGVAVVAELTDEALLGKAVVVQQWSFWRDRVGLLDTA